MADASSPHLYAIALGSNRRHGRHGAPGAVLTAALSALELAGIAVARTSQTMSSAAIGPSLRCYANSVALIETPVDPPQLLAILKRIERDFGRRRGRRWGARVLDLDIILWSGGVWSGQGLSVPHRAWRERRFVTDPLASIAPDWSDPATGLTVHHIAHRLRRARPVDPAPRTA